MSDDKGFMRISMRVNNRIISTAALLIIAACYLMLAEKANSGAARLQVDLSGLKNASFGAPIEVVQKAFGKKIIFSNVAVNAGPQSLDCVWASVDKMYGIHLRFEKGRFAAILISSPIITSVGGLNVGDAEAKVVAILRNDPTLEIGENRYDDTVKEIRIGKAEVVGTPEHWRWQGTNIKYTIKDGVVAGIEAGEASYVMLDEHEENCL